MPPSIYVTPHFRWDEFRCNDGTAVPPRYRANAEELAARLELIRALLGGLPITITSGYRSPAWNARVKGAKTSQHMRGAAADFVVAAMTPKQVADAIDAAIKRGDVPDGGLGRYRGWTHYDIGPARRWRG